MRIGSRMLALVLCALVAAGCGGSSENGDSRYVQRVNTAQGTFAARINDLSKGITATSSAAHDRRTLRSFEQAVGDVSSDLRAIKPPAEVRPLHARLIRAVDGYGADVRAAANALRSHDPDRLRAAQRRLSQQTAVFGTTLNETIDEINRKLRS